MKVCTKCGDSKSFLEFPKDKSKKDGYHTFCKLCHAEAHRVKRANSTPEQLAQLRKRSRDWRIANPEKALRGVRSATLKKKYGITLEEYELLLTKQQGLCAICSTPESQWGSLAVDHDHITGVVRGLLCFNCNTSIGKLNDDPALLRRAAEYLESSSRS